mmetsp:Transcript_69921/g.155833  ORF Transcript_69921/g.155833 Transcript_69921/m.155833 type:complete len:217 (-) Transcript_69921:1129-1779(-)
MDTLAHIRQGGPRICTSQHSARPSGVVGNASTLGHSTLSENGVWQPHGARQCAHFPLHSDAKDSNTTSLTSHGCSRLRCRERWPRIAALASFGTTSGAKPIAPLPNQQRKPQTTTAKRVLRTPTYTRGVWSCGTWRAVASGPASTQTPRPQANQLCSSLRSKIPHRARPWHPWPSGSRAHQDYPPHRSWHRRPPASRASARSGRESSSSCAQTLCS